MARHDFALDELFFSRTDRKGVIRSGNGVFARVSGYGLEEMIGRPHNLVRHPEMPRVAFRLLWETIETGAPFAAYVQNRASDGEPYWVIAAVVPAGDGYLSVRLKPTGPHLAAARGLYAELRALERSIEGERGRERKRAIEVSRERLAPALRELGFDGYETFMRTALASEIAAREEQLGDRRRGGPAQAGDATGPLAEILEQYEALEEVLDALFANVSAYATLGEKLRGTSRFVLELAGDMRLYALNALLGSTHLGERGAALGAVASLMQQRSDAGGDVLRRLNAAIDAAIAQLSALAFAISLSKLQAEMAVSFTRELATGTLAAGDAGRVAEDLAALADCVGSTVGGLLDGLPVLEERLATLPALAAALGRDLDVLRTLQLNGRIEAARAGDAHAVLALFDEIGRRVATSRAEVSGFDGVVASAAALDAGTEQVVRGRLATLQETTSELQPASTTGARSRERRPVETITSPARMVPAPAS